MGLYETQEPAGNAGVIAQQAVTNPRTRAAAAVERQAPVEKGFWRTALSSPLWLCLLAGVLIRVALSIRTHGTLDGDEALLGIQAEHILQGERPIYFYGLSYFGSLEAYIVAGVSAIFGPSVAVLRGVTTFFGLVVIALTWWFARLLTSAARLPRYAEICFATCAALVAAIPPVYDGIIELRTGGGWIESFAIMLVLLILAFQLTTRWHTGASTGELALWWAAIGLAVGFGMWIYPLVVVAIAAAALWIVGDSLLVVVRHIRASEPFKQAIWPSLTELLLALVAIPTCLLGFTPGLIWGASHHWTNISYLFSLGNGSGWTLQRVKTISGVTERYLGCVAPRVISGATPNENLLLTVIHTPLLLLGVGALLFSFVAILLSYRRPSPMLIRARSLIALPTLFGFCTAALFCTNAASTAILLGCHNDLGGRYASPLALALSFFIAAAFTALVMFVLEKAPQLRFEASASIQQILRAAFAPSQRKYSLTLAAVFVVLLAYLGGQVSTYELTNPDEAFQSAYCPIAPANYAPIIAYLERQHVKYVWGTNLLVNPISFLTNSQIIVADPEALVHPRDVINRIPSYTTAVATVDRPTLLTLVNHGDPHPYLLKLLDTQGVTYNVAYFPSQPGVDVMVVTPLNQTVSPITTPSLDVFYCQIINSKSDIPVFSK